MLDDSQTASCEIILVCGTASFEITMDHVTGWLSILLSQSFLKIGLLVYCTWWQLIIVSSDWWSQIIFKNKNNTGNPNVDPFGPKLGVLPFSQIWFISFLEIAYKDSLQQYLRFSRGKIHTYKMRLGFLQFSQVWFISFP